MCQRSKVHLRSPQGARNNTIHIDLTQYTRNTRAQKGWNKLQNLVKKLMSSFPVSTAVSNQTHLSTVSNACSYCKAAQAHLWSLSVINQANYQLKHKVQNTTSGNKIKAMQYHLLMVVLAEYSSSYSLFAHHIMLASSIWLRSNTANFPNHCAARSLLPHNLVNSPSTM